MVDKVLAQGEGGSAPVVPPWRQQEDPHIRGGDGGPQHHARDCGTAFFENKKVKFWRYPMLKPDKFSFEATFCVFWAT